MIRLFTSLYPESSPTRFSELAECLKRNLDHQIFDEVYLILESIERPAFGNSVTGVRRIDSRPTFREFFQWANELAKVPSDITVIANSDIYFDRSFRVFSKALKSEQCAALARWDSDGTSENVLFDRNDSQDVWVFRGPLRKIDGDFCVGVPRCDNRILYELKRAGYQVINPSFSIRSYHLHEGIREEYQNDKLEHFVEPPYAYLWPHNLWSLPRTLIHNLRYPDARIGWRFDRRKFLNYLPVRASRKMARTFGSSMAKSNT